MVARQQTGTSPQHLLWFRNLEDSLSRRDARDGYRIGSLRLENRIAMSAMGVAIIDDDGFFREHAIRYYEERAREQFTQ